MATQLTTQTLVLIIVALILLTVGLLAIAQASGLTNPLFDQIAKLINSLTVPGVGK